MEFNKFADCMREYLKETKCFVKNPVRIADVEHAMEMAQRMFPDSKVCIKDDPLQLGSLILYVEDFDIVVKETKDFNTLVAKADNFEIYPIKNEKIAMSIMFNGTFIRL